MVPGRRGSALSLDVQEVQQHCHNHTGTPENTRSSNDGDGSGDGSNGSASAMEYNPHLLYLILARSRSLRFCNALALCSTPLLFRSLAFAYVTELSRESPNRPSSVAWHVGDTTTSYGLSGVSASSLSLPFESIPFSFLNLSSSISVISARIVIQNLVTLSLGTNPYQELAESSH